MTALQNIYMVYGTVITLSLLFFIYSSIRENCRRAAIIGLIFLAITATAGYGAYYLFSANDLFLISAIAIVTLFAVLFFMPLGKSKTMRYNANNERVDERDTIFAREEYLPGSKRYQSYYARHPELKDIDDKTRKQPEILSPGGRYYDPVRSGYVSSIFSVIHGMTTDVDGEVGDTPVDDEPERLTSLIKELTLHLGAAEVGIARLNPAYVYSHVGRGPEKWGSPINNDHKFVVVFTLEMDYEYVSSAPEIPIIEESAREYLHGSTISITLAQYIRRLGYPARAHVSDSNYQIMLVPAAVEAGLGELGRFGYLISAKYGARVRLGAVTTDLPLISDEPINLGVQDFCEKCLRCADNCPSASIPRGGKTKVRGAEKWLLEPESCIQYWRAIGTDCGLCMKVCPFSHPDSILHNMVRTGIKRSAFARRVSLYAEDIFYGRKATW